MDFGKKVVILCFKFSPYRFTKNQQYRIDKLTL